LVIGTMNTTSAHKTVDRVIESFPPNEQDAVRLALSETLRLVICQRLLPRADQPGQVACFEILPCVQNVRTLIRDDKVYQLPGIMELGRSQGMRTADMSLEALMDAGKITPEDAYIRAVKKETFEGMVSAQFLAEIQALEPPKIDDDPSGDGRGPMPSGNPAPSVGSSI
jgi:twitching motility protein PilT